jgi:glycosyltransferase involved in cell wall biosynthesis
MPFTNAPSISFALATGLTNGGVTTWALTLSKRLKEKGYPSNIICHSSPPGQITFAPLDRDDIVYCEGPNAWGADVNAIHSFVPTYSSLEPAIFIPNWSWGTYATVALMSLHARSDLRVIAFAHTDEDHYYELLTYYEPIISQFVAVSDTIHQTLRRLLPSRLNDISKLSYPVPVIGGSKLYNHSRPLVITYAGRIWQQQKRILDLIPLVELLALKKGAYHFKIAGDGPYLTQLVEFFNTKRYTNVSADFLGLVAYEKMKDVWEGSDVSILFSEYEGMSISMLESMGQGCVPVVTDVSGSREAIVHGETGFIVPIGDVESMATIINALELDRALVKRISEACILSIRDRYGFDRYDQALVKIIQQSVHKSSAKWPISKAILPAKDAPRPPSIYRSVRGKAGRLLMRLKTFSVSKEKM